MNPVLYYTQSGDPASEAERFLPARARWVQVRGLADRHGALARPRQVLFEIKRRTVLRRAVIPDRCACQFPLLRPPHTHRMNPAPTGTEPGDRGSRQCGGAGTRARCPTRPWRAR